MKRELKMLIEKAYKKMVPRKLKRSRYLAKIKRNTGAGFEEAEKRINREYKVSGSGDHINWDDPVRYTEKINVSKLYHCSMERAVLSDKMAVRKWVSEKIGEEYLIPLYGVYDDFDDIDFDALPDRFVLKCNHDSGSVRIVDKKEINRSQLDSLKEDYRYFLKRRYAYVGFELHYDLIKPRILAEKYMGGNISDYKFFCFGGEPFCVAVHYDRKQGHKCNIYDMDWKLLPFVTNDKNGKAEVKCPPDFAEMKELARVLSVGYDHVRVDFYYIDGRIYFGEMTFTPAGGRMRIDPPEWDEKLGRLWKFDKGKRSGILKKYKKTDEIVDAIRKGTV